MHLLSLGHGDRTVVLEAGLGGWSLDMRPLQTELARTTRVCTYDRAGYGWSDPGQAPRTGMQIVAELEALLEAAGQPGPYILAGHSFGGLTMLMFAEAHPDDVAGVVLIDSSHPGQQEAFDRVPAMVTEQATELAELEALAARIEKGLVDGSEAMAMAPDFLPPDLQHQWATLIGRTSGIRTAMAELDAWSQTAAHVGGPGSLGDIPLTVLARGLGIASEVAFFAEHPEDARRVDAIWRRFQEDHLTRSSNARLVIAENSGHYIHGSEPELVIDAIRALMETT